MKWSKILSSGKMWKLIVKKTSSNLGPDKPKKCLIILSIFLLSSSYRGKAVTADFNKATGYISIGKMFSTVNFDVCCIRK